LGKRPKGKIQKSERSGNARKAKFEKVSVRAMPARQNCQKLALGERPKGKIEKNSVFFIEKRSNCFPFCLRVIKKRNKKR